MKIAGLLLTATVMFAACNSEGTSEEATETTTETVETAQVEDPNAIKDPVCDMVKDDTWTDYSVNGTDTTWFCSETCKDAFAANPAKYTKS